MAKKKVTVGKKAASAGPKRKKPAAGTVKKASVGGKKKAAGASSRDPRSKLVNAYQQLFEAHADVQKAYIEELKVKADKLVEKGRLNAHKEIADLERKLGEFRGEYENRAKGLSKMGEASWNETKSWFLGRWGGLDESVKKLLK